MSLESDVCDRKGCWVYFDKIIPKEDDSNQAAAAAAAGKKAPPKGKVATPAEESKPTHARAWLDLTPLKHPGASNLEQRIFLQATAAADANLSERPDTVGNASSKEGVTQGEDFTCEIEEDIFAAAQTYISLSFSLSEPLYPEADFTHIKKDGKGLVAKFTEPKKYPTTQDAITTFEAAIDYIVVQVSQEYVKTTQEGEHEVSKGPSSAPSKAGNATAFLSSKQLEAMAENRRERFLVEFTQSNKYVEIKNKLQEAIFRLGVEKFKRQIGSGKQLTKEDKSKFKAELYIFLQKKLKDCLNRAIKQGNSIPVDIVTQFEQLQESAQIKIEESYQENEVDKVSRLAAEFDKLDDVDNSERQRVN